MNTSSELDIRKAFSVLNRHKGFMIAVFLVVFSLTGFLAVRLPDVYRSSALILVTPQKLPPSYIPSTVTMSIQDRANAVTQQILSRTNLEKINKEFGLYPESGSGTITEEPIEKLRRRIKIEVQPARADMQGSNRGSGRVPQESIAFILSFGAETPAKAVQVTTRLISLFIEENLKAREEQAIGTTTFIGSEIERVRKELEEQEGVVNQYKRKYAFELPDQLNANLNTLERLRSDLVNDTVRLSALEERKVNIEKQLAEIETAAQEAPVLLAADGKLDSSQKTLESKRSQLDVLLTQYGEKHPDIKNLRNEIKALEAGASSQKSQTETKESPSSATSLARNPLRDTLLKQLSETRFELSTLRARNEVSRRDIVGYQARVENAPLRAIELSKISRGYEMTLKKYQDLVGKEQDSRVSENMEKKQKGEQFQILDSANVPAKPEFPNRPLILLAGFLGGLAASFGFALLLETLDTSFKRSDEMEGFVPISLLASIPAIVTRQTIFEKRRAQGLLILVSLGTVAIGIVAIRLSIPFFFS